MNDDTIIPDWTLAVGLVLAVPIALVLGGGAWLWDRVRR